jgi:hypothetical protein
MPANEVATEDTTRANTGKIARELLAELMPLLEELTKAIDREYPEP